MSIKEIIRKRRELCWENPKFRAIEHQVRELMKEVELQDRAQLTADLTLMVVDAYAEQMLLSGMSSAK